MSKQENVDENVHTRRGVKHSIKHKLFKHRWLAARSWKLKREWHRSKLIEVLTDLALLERVVYGKEGRDWKWV